MNWRSFPTRNDRKEMQKFDADDRRNFMTDNSRQKKHFPANALRICIDSCINGDLGGRAYSRLQAEPIVFISCSELLLKTDRMFDRKGYPQTFQQKRTFSGGEEQKGYCSNPVTEMESEQILEQDGKITTFDIVVQSRRKAGWQGFLRQKDESGSAAFESELELLRCIVEAIGEI